MKSLIAVSLSMLLLATTSFAQEKEASTKVDPTGTWRWERTRNDSVIKMTLKLKWEGDKLVGTLATQRPDGAQGRGGNEPIKIEDAKLDGNKISFTATRSFNDRQMVSKYAGVIDGDSIKGTQARETNDGTQESEWNPKRGITLQDAAGTWAISFESPNGDKINSKFDITVDGEKAKGVYHSTRFGDNDITDVAVKDGKLTFVVSMKTDNGDFKMNYEATIKDDKINGTMKSDFGDQDFTREFEGSREAKDAK